MTEIDYMPMLGSPSTPVVVTGGASGIGLATASALAAVGRPVSLWDIDGDKARAEAARIGAKFGVLVLGQRVDLRDPQAVSPAALAARDALGPIGGLVHCAGTAEQTGIEGVTPDNWDAGLALHARAVIQLVQAFLADLKVTPGSAVVALSSINASFGNGTIPIYSAAKGAVISLVRSMADELAGHGIRINTVSPGMIDTPILGAARDAMEGVYRSRIMLGRFGRPEEIGRAIRFLLSDEASYLTAEDLVIDGGILRSQRP
ncbi:SDR family NAD(P)-dependent oxidoreductase [Parafrankia sp. BMG5.11]|uniref:SDR family NAD(P)-dependent oxidoreductase n=1 Tax=Parafrankia sp. BMG5.11 TaxID=222540 RepID=UPI001038EEAC|nr:SDR family oxidoreductase [Parafrankia sp. BMG5.11]TCJ37015.1 SDR family oxidoreductase [Parafrankia sp. BMG5.11]